MFAPRINFIAIVTCVVFQFVFGLIWYSPWVFGDLWFSFAQLTLEEFDSFGIRPYVLSIVALFTATYVLAWLVVATHSTTARSGAKIGFMVWLGFLAPVLFSTDAFRGYELNLAMLESGANFFNFVIAGAVLGSWRRRL